MAKKVTPETEVKLEEEQPQVVGQEEEQVAKPDQEQVQVEEKPQEPVEPQAVAKPQEQEKPVKVHAVKAAQIARNFGVTTVWGTSDGRHWATDKSNINKLPVGAVVEEYSFEIEQRTINSE